MHSYLETLAAEILTKGSPAHRLMRDCIHHTYSAAGPDLGWTDDVPDDSTFVDVISDHLRSFAHDWIGDWGTGGPEITADDLCDAFFRLSARDRSQIILSVGP